MNKLPNHTALKEWASVIAALGRGDIDGSRPVLSDVELQARIASVDALLTATV